MEAEDVSPTTFVKEVSMKRLVGSIALGGLLIILAGCAGSVGAQQMAPPPAEYKKVSSLVALPDYLPGMGTLYVDPKTLPAGPFLAYDKEGHLVSSIYMVPMKDLDAHKKFDDLKVAKEKVDHVDLYYNAGHPGVAEPHYHIVLWYVSPDKEPK
jgi:hypothetical protein